MFIFGIDNALNNKPLVWKGTSIGALPVVLPLPFSIKPFIEAVVMYVPCFLLGVFSSLMKPLIAPCDPPSSSMKD